MWRPNRNSSLLRSGLVLAVDGSGLVDTFSDADFPALCRKPNEVAIHLQPTPFAPSKPPLCRRKRFPEELVQVESQDAAYDDVCDKCLGRLQGRVREGMGKLLS